MSKGLLENPSSENDQDKYGKIKKSPIRKYLLSSQEEQPNLLNKSKITDESYL